MPEMNVPTVKLINVIVFLLLALGLFTACKKGCVDRSAKNYDSRAKKDNGTCNYEGSAVLWYDEKVSNELKNDGVTRLDFFLNDVLISSHPTSDFWNSAPDCGETGSVTFVQDLGENASQEHRFTVKDQFGFVQWTGALVFKSQTCLHQQLIP
jgi:hypothetical protein